MSTAVRKVGGGMCRSQRPRHCEASFVIRVWDFFTRVDFASASFVANEGGPSDRTAPPC